MRKYLLLSAMTLTVACKKNDRTGPIERTAQPEMVSVTYQVQSFTDAPFSSVRYNDMRKDEPGIHGVELKDWIINGKGTFTKTVRIERGYGLWLSAKNITSGDYILSIKTKYEEKSARGTDFYPIPGVDGYLVSIDLANRP